MSPASARRAPGAVDGLYAGQGMLPVCVSGDMRWSATVLVATANGRVAAPFHFNVPAH